MTVRLILAFYVAVSAISCGSHEAAAPTLPDSWHKLPEDGGGERASREEPSPDFDSRVVASFRAHSEALSGLSELPAPEAVPLEGAPKNWTPWHLDGMSASFTVSTGGIFGALMGAGAATVKGVWEKKLDEGRRPASRRKTPTVRFTSRTTKEDVAKLMEPIVRAAVATKSVENKELLRRNLNRKGGQFLALARALSRVKSRRAWEVDAFGLQLSFSASGQVSAAVGVGGTFSVYLEWSREGEELQAGAPRVAAIDDAVIYRKMGEFTDLMASMIPDFHGDSGPIRRLGFDFNEFQVGIAVTVGGDIGIAQVQGGISGKMKFKRNDAWFDDRTERSEPAETTPLLLIGPPPSAEHRTFIAAHDIKVSAVDGLWASDEPAMVYELSRQRFREGMKKAVSMATYFAGKARSADTSAWRIAYVETEFDASISGDIVVVNVFGQGQMVLGFSRVTK